MVFLMRSSMVVSHWSRRDTESKSLTASVNASLFCSSWASSSFCCNRTWKWVFYKKSWWSISLSRISAAANCTLLYSCRANMGETPFSVQRHPQLPSAVWALWSLRRLGTSPRTSQWPAGKHKRSKADAFRGYRWDPNRSCDCSDTQMPAVFSLPCSRDLDTFLCLQLKKLPFLHPTVTKATACWPPGAARVNVYLSERCTGMLLLSSHLGI